MLWPFGKVSVTEISNTMGNIVGFATVLPEINDDAQRRAIAADKTLNRKERRKRLSELRRKKR